MCIKCNLFTDFQSDSGIDTACGLLQTCLQQVRKAFVLCSSSLPHTAHTICNFVLRINEVPRTRECWVDQTYLLVVSSILCHFLPRFWFFHVFPSSLFCSCESGAVGSNGEQISQFWEVHASWPCGFFKVGVWGHSDVTLFPYLYADLLLRGFLPSFFLTLFEYRKKPFKGRLRKPFFRTFFLYKVSS